MNIIVDPGPVAAAAPLDLDEPLYEIIDGLRVEMPPMSTLANAVANRLSHKLDTAGEQSDRGHAFTDMLFHLALPVDRNRRPDVAFVSFDRWPKDRPWTSDNAWDVAPDLAVEVTSPNDFADDLVVKLDEYFRAGVPLVWVVYPKQAMVHVYESLTQVRGFTRADVLEGGSVLPEFRLALNELFQPP